MKITKKGVLDLGIFDRIVALLGERGQRELTDFLKLNKTAFTDWKSGKSNSYRKYLIEIAEFFNVSIDYLVYGKEFHTTELKADEREILDIYNNLSETNKERLKERAVVLSEIESSDMHEHIKPEITDNRINMNTTARVVARSTDNAPPRIVTGDFSDIIDAPDSTDEY